MCYLWGLLRQLTVNSPFRAQTTARFGCAWPRASNKARQWPLGQAPGMTKIKDIAACSMEGTPRGRGPGPSRSVTSPALVFLLCFAFFCSHRRHCSRRVHAFGISLRLAPQRPGNSPSAQTVQVAFASFRLEIGPNPCNQPFAMTGDVRRIMQRFV